MNSVPNRKKELNEKYSGDFNVIDKVEEISIEVFRPVEFANNDIVKGVIWALSGKAFRTFRATKILCEQGYGPDALILCRTLLELVFNMLFIQEKDSVKRAEMFTEFEWVVKMQGWERESVASESSKTKIEIEKAKELGIDKKIAENYLNTLKKYPHFKKNYYSPFGWTDEKPDEIAKRFNMFYYYRIVYWMASHFSHTTANSLASYVKIDDETGERKVIIGPSDDLIQPTLRTSSILMLRVLEITDKVLQLNKALLISSGVEYYEQH